MASLPDILTAEQNIAKAINGLGQTYLSVQGQANLAGLTAATLVESGPGRVCEISVLVAGSAVGAVYDTTNVSAPTRKLYVIPETVGVFVVNLPTQYGIVVFPGTGQTVTIS